MITTAGRVKRKNQGSSLPKAQSQQKTPAEQLEDALQARDFSKATTMLEFYKNSGQSIGDMPINPWLAYSAFHMNDIVKAIEVYKQILAQESCDPMNYIYLGCCHFLNGSYKEAQEAALRGPECSLQTRLLFQICQRTLDEEQLLKYHQKLQNTVEDQLCLASAQYTRTHYQEAIEVFKRILLHTRDYVALNVYVAMCYFKMDYFEVSLEVLNIYLQTYSNSAVAINLKACNHYRLYNGSAAETELKVLIDLHRTTYNVEQDIVKHNLVVFRNGEDALQVLPPMLNVGIPEARLNLILYHLRNEQVNEAYELIRDVEPTITPEYIIKAVVYAYVGQQIESADHLKISREYFNFIGSTPSECDTIQGRQCMASYFFLMRDFANVLVYLKSIKPYFPNDDTFRYLYGIACAGTGEYAEAEEALTSVRSKSICSEFCYSSWLARTYIMNKHTKKAWDYYLKMETQESIGILRLMANDCYRTSAFYYAARAYDVLERIDADMEYIDGKKYACIGVFQQVYANEEQADALFDVIKMLESSAQVHAADKHLSEEFSNIATMMKDWSKEAKLKRR